MVQLHTNNVLYILSTAYLACYTYECLTHVQALSETIHYAINLYNFGKLSLTIDRCQYVYVILRSTIDIHAT